MLPDRWISSAHEEWVLLLATKLRENDVDVISDRWDLREGNDAYAFMEKMVNDPEIRAVSSSIWMRFQTFTRPSRRPSHVSQGTDHIGPSHSFVLPDRGV